MEGVIELSLKVVCVETVVLASVSELGDLASYAMVSQVAALCSGSLRVP